MSENEKLEQTCRETFLSWTLTNEAIWDVYFTPGKWDRTDCTYFSGITPVICELKKRKHLHTTRWNGRPDGFVFEKIKFDALMSSPITSKHFVVIFLDKIVIWDIASLKNDLVWNKEMLSSDHTCSNDVEKTTCYLTIKQASHIYNR